MEETPKDNATQINAENGEKIASLLKKINDYERILETMGIFYYDIDKDGIIRAFDMRFCKALNFSDQELLGLPFSAICDDSFQGDFVSSMNAVLETHTSERRIDNIRLRKKDTVLDTEIYAIPQTLEDGNPGYRLLVQDVNHRKKMEDLIRKFAFEDTLTGLPNRRLFMDRLVLQLNHAKRSNGQFAIILMDLDYFKEVNDTKGHATGDELLHHIAQRLVKAVREEDTVARMGGDEFILLFPALRNAGNGNRIGDKLVKVFKKPFLLENHKIHITASIGIAIYPDHGDNIAFLLRNSDRAMYAAKKNGRNRYEFYSDEIGGNGI